MRVTLMDITRLVERFRPARVLISQDNWQDLTLSARWELQGYDPQEGAFIRFNSGVVVLPEPRIFRKGTLDLTGESPVMKE